MKKFVAALILASVAFTAQAALSETYLKKKLHRSQVTTVSGLVDLYLADTGQTKTVNAAKVTVLLNGKPDRGASEFITKAERVTVSSEGPEITINIITRAVPGGA